MSFDPNSNIEENLLNQYLSSLSNDGSTAERSRPREVERRSGRD